MASFTSSNLVQIITVGLKNAIPLFKSVISGTISKYNCKRLMRIWMTVQCVSGLTREEHEENLKCFLNATKKCSITFTKGRVPTPPIPSSCWAITFRTAFCSRILTVSSHYYKCQCRRLARTSNALWKC